MRALVNLDACQGYANCVIEAPAIFDIDDDSGMAVVLVETISVDLIDDARRAEANCPARAIVLA